MSGPAADLAVLPAPLFDLDLTLGCGQVFHWVRHGAGYLGAIGDRAAYVEQGSDSLLVTRGLEEVAQRYFALDHPLEEIYASFPADEAMQKSLAFCRGLRVIRQPLWECLATFITSSMKQVGHIAAMSHALRQRFGERLALRGETLFAYPSPARLAEASEEDLRACGLGYRAANLRRTAQMVARGEVNLEALRSLAGEEALAALRRLPGVGIKVANCALLFGWERLEAFPIDVWIERVLREIYFARKRKVTARRMQEFSATYFGPYGGYAQQYLFHYARKAAPKPARKKPRRKQLT